MLNNMVHSRTLNLHSYNLIEWPVFIKDKLGRYLWANSFFISRSSGCSSLGEISNKMDTDFPWHAYADVLRSNDNAVLSAQQSQSHYEHIVRHDGTFVNILTRKCPLYDDNEGLLGLIGFSIEVPRTKQIALLSKREKECVSFLSKGYTDR